jgi:phenylacetate-CoA ligase
MSFLGLVKSHLTQMPFFVGKSVSLVPYNCRPGLAGTYRQRTAEISQVGFLSPDDQKEFIFRRVQEIAIYANRNIPFYVNLYRGSDVQPERFNSFYDLSNLPVITKADLQKVPLEHRSIERPGRSLVNTGGSSGQPLEFFIEPDSIGHEWAHMHHIWNKLSFKQSDLKVVFGGRADVRSIVQYDSARHQINVDLYSGWPAIADSLLQIFKKYSPKYLHGYPSSLFDFVIWLESVGHPLFPVLRKNIKGMFLGSEFPSPPLREIVEKLLDCKGVSWYGHTERGVLAYEKEEHGCYHPFLTYGFAESLGEGRLVCTSYYNRASPLIRYDTGDLVEPTYNEGLLEKFKINKGREGEFVVDKLGNKIFLTGLIFGRHHELFDRARHIQIYQPSSGMAEVLVTPRDILTPESAAASFDSSNVNLDFIFKILQEPVRTKAGKVPLLVKQP